MTTPLEILQDEWVIKSREMREQFPGQTTRLHLTVAPDGYAPEQIPSVLYVGKAIGPNEPEEEDLNAEQLREKTREFLRSWAAGETRAGGFCQFGLQLSDALKTHTGRSNIAPLQNLVWSNLCKIGQTSGNPNAEIYGGQCELAIDTLRAEIEHYKPGLIYWATYTNYYQVVFGALRESDDNSWTKDLQNAGIYTRPARGSLPAMIWTAHPQGKPRKTWNFWSELACALMAA